MQCFYHWPQDHDDVGCDIAEKGNMPAASCDIGDFTSMLVKVVGINEVAE